MNSLKRPRLAGLMFGMLLMCVCDGKGCPLRGLDLLRQSVAYEDRNTDEDREVDDASDDEQGRGCGSVHVLFGLVMPLRAKVNC